jgi:SET domain-containing protein
VKCDLKIPVLDLDKSYVNIPSSLPKPKEEIEGNVSVPRIKIAPVKANVDIGLKKGELSSSSPRSDEKKKKKRGIDLKVCAKLEVPKIDKPEMKGDLKIPVLEVDKTKPDIGPSLPKEKKKLTQKFQFYQKMQNLNLI